MATIRAVNRPVVESHSYDFASLETRFVLACLRSMWDGQALSEAYRLSRADEFSWVDVIALVQAERIAPLLYRTVCQQNWLPADLLQELRRDYILTAGRNTLLFQELENIILLLAKTGLSVIPLKGAALVDTVYGTVAVRPMFDIDILVRASQAGAAVALLEQGGYVRVMVEPRTGTLLDYENEITLVQTGDTAFPVELHWSLIDSPYYQRVLDMEWFWQTSVPAHIGQSATRFLGVEATLLHLCAHLVLHHRGNGLLWLHDVAALLHENQDRIDWETVVHQADAFGLTSALRSVLSLVQAHWQAPLPEKLLVQLAALPISGYEERALTLAETPPDAVAQRFVQDVVSLPTWRQRGDFIVRNLFPSPEYMRWRYAIVRRWQIPFYYPYRWFLGLASAWRNHE